MKPSFLMVFWITTITLLPKNKKNINPFNSLIQILFVNFKSLG